MCQTEDVEKTIATEIDEHQAKMKSIEDEDKAEEVQHPYTPASQVNGAEASKQPETQEDIMEDSKQQKPDLVGADTTNDEQATADKSPPELDPSTNEDKPEVHARGREEEIGKSEEKASEDHGGEELVEGQEDDVIY